MKTRTKALLLVLSAIILVVATVFGTLAYLTAESDVVTNTFTVGKVAITLDEADVDEYGDEIKDADRVTENEYKLISGHTYTKDPTIHIGEKSESAYIFAKVENGISTIEVPADDENNSTIAEQLVTLGWTPVAEGSDVYYYKEFYNAEADEPQTDFVVFETFTVNGAADETALNAQEDSVIKITGYAVQKDGFNSAVDAWNATFGASAN